MPRYSVNPIREFTINDTYPVLFRTFDIAPDTVRLADGDILVVWSTPGDSFLNRPGIAIRRYNADGTPDSGPVLLADVGRDPSVAALADGGYVVVWTRYAGDHVIQYQRFDSADNPVGGIVDVSSVGIDQDALPEAVGLPNGGWTITWQSGPDPLTHPGPSDIYARTYDSAGVAGAETLVSTLAGDDTDANLVVLSDGSVAILWTRNVGAPDEEVRLSRNGAQTVINGAGSGDDVNVQLLPDGRLIVVWSGSDGVRAAFVAADGTPGTSFLVHDGSDAEVAVFPDGSFVVVWCGNDPDPTGGFTIEAQVFDANGNALAGGFYQHDTGTLRGTEETLSVSVAGPNEFFVAWSSHGGDDRLLGAVFSYSEAFDFVGTPDADDFTGGNGDDTALGLGGNDTLTGGLGNDRLEGGQGDDIYHVDNEGDTIVEAVGGGNDTVYTTATFHLDAGAEIETFATEDAAGTDPLGLYGNAFVQTITGNAGANLLSGGGGADTLIGLGGDDTYLIASGTEQIQEIAGQGNDTVTTHIDFTLAAGVSVEIMIAVNGARITGNELGQALYGSDESSGSPPFVYTNDHLDGGGGADIMRGYQGDDTYVVDNAGDQAIEAVGQGQADRVRTSVSYHLGFGQEIEFLETTDAAGTAPLTLTGNAFRQTITGNAGANLIQGIGGIDTLVGLGGNDTYYVDVAQTTVQEAAGGGTDVLYASVSYALAAGQEIETLSTNSHAATASINLTGNGLNQTLLGNAGNNILHGGGGTDQLAGFGGNDTYYTDVATTIVYEDVGGGTDVLYTSVTYVLGGGKEVETLSTNNNAATTAINLTGNSFNQTLVGNAGANILHGGGGTDLLIGFGGNDTYYTDVATTQVLENAGGGTDVLYTSVSYVLGGGQEIETLSTNSHAATAAINLTGNSFNQLLLGNAGNNILHGGGGTDQLAGFGGNDTYYTDVAGTIVYEAAGGGTDVLYTSVSYTLGAGVEVETLSTNSHAATVAIDLTGNETGQTLLGNAGANILNGGLGNDLLAGFGGADSFAFTTALGATNVDTIHDFVSGTDRILLDDAVFAGIGGPGALAAGAFATGTAAAEADDRIVYDGTTGRLYFDADGSGAGAAVLFAILTGNPALAASDFMVI